MDLSPMHGANEAPSEQLHALSMNDGDHCASSLPEGRIQSSDRIVDMTVSADGQHFAVACGPFARVYDSTTGEEQCALRHSHNQAMSVLTVRFSPDNKNLATGSKDGVIRVWNLKEIHISIALTHKGHVQAIDFLDNNTLVSGSSRDDMVRVWDISSGINTHALDANGPVTAVTTSLNGTYVAAGCEDGSVCLWHAASGIPVARQRKHTGKVTSVALSADGKALMSGGQDQSIWHWNSGTLGEGDNLISTSGNRVATLDGPHDHALSVVMMPDGEHVVAGASDGSVWLCCIRGAKRLISKHKMPAIAVAMSSEASLDSTVLASASEDEWTIQAYPCPHDHLVGVDHGSLCTFEHAPARILRGHTHAALAVHQVHSFPHESTVCCVVFSHDANKLATGCNGRVHVFDVKTGRELYMLEHQNVKRTTADNHVRTVSFGMGDGYLATGAQDGVIRLWGTDTRTVLKSFEVQGEVLSLEFSSDGRIMASCDSDNTVRLWNIATGKATATLHLDEGPMAVAISPDGEKLAVGCSDRSVHVRGVRSGSFGAPFRTLGCHGDIVYSVTWSSNGLISASLDRTMKRWRLSDLSTVECVGHFEGHQDIVLSAVDDNTLVLSGSKDRSVGLWDPVTGEQMLLVPAHNNSVISVASSCQPGYFATGSADGARLWFYHVE